ncbi:MAG: glycosyltransferase [Gammaproteobacteria bacterium]|nr:glycosyltransferase [Gammaproteobacteria bacterium]MDH5691591.1 glycosyltransferase [Gammaproteobacteria bacterium]
MLSRPKLLVFTILFPSQTRPNAGLFIKARMFRVAKELPVTVVCPVPWFPLQGLIRLLKPHFRPKSPKFEMQDGIEVYYPRYFSVPGLFKKLDGFFIFLGSYFLVKRLHKNKKFDLIDAHFAYPDGYAASFLARSVACPFTITLRGTEVPHAKTNKLPLMIKALNAATHIFSVSNSLKEHAVGFGISPNKISVVGNGVDLEKFSPQDRESCRQSLGLSKSDQILISVGGLVERKGFHRVIEVLPQVRNDHPNLKFLIVGGGSPEGSMESQLQEQVKALGLEKAVHFLGPKRPEELKFILSAADVFVLATSNEGWANVFLEAMACGLPVVTTKVGGNAEVVSNSDLGLLVEFGDKAALATAIIKALNTKWDEKGILDYAKNNSWDSRVTTLVSKFEEIYSDSQSLTREALKEQKTI